MKEFVGKCHSCEREVVCMDGFLNGVVTDEGVLYCFNCADEDSK